MSDRCLAPKCNRPLTTDESRARGYGRVCWGRLNPAAPQIAAPARTANPDQIPLPLEKPVDAEAAHSLVDRLVDTDPLKLRDALFAVISKLETLAGRNADTDDVVDEIRTALESQLG